ncbi:MAG TPA: hypothetical protein VF168_04685 [Trueperaceae bacterium]
MIGKSLREFLIPRALTGFGAVVMLGLCLLEALFSGLTSSFFAYLALTALSLQRAFDDRLGTRVGYWVNSYSEWALVLLVCLPLVGGVIPRVDDLPIFAHVDVEARSLGSSATVRADIAPPGHRFVVVEAVVKPRMLANVGYLYYGDFLLHAGGTSFEVAHSSLEVPGACRDLPRTRLRATRCNLVFEVPQDIGSGWLEYDEYPFGAKSEVFSLPARQARVPRVAIEVLHVESVSRIARPFGKSADQDKTYLYVDLRLESVEEPRPFELDTFILEGEGWEAFDRSDRYGVSDPCSGLVLDGTATCTALFEAPRDAREPRLTTHRYDFEDDYAVEIAGVASLTLPER